MSGADFYTAVSSLIDGFSLDTTLFYQMLNTARIRRELSRPFMRLRKYDFSQTVGPISVAPTTLPPSASITLPTDFLYLNRDGEITLYDSVNTWQTFTEIAMNLIIPYLQVNNVFYVDHAAGKAYFLGIIDKAYKAFVPYQANLGDITAGSTWLNIPSAFHMILAYDVAAMYRLGVDYDDINARNASENGRQAEALFNSMVVWDDNLQRSATTRMNYPVVSDDAGANFNHKIDIG